MRYEQVGTETHIFGNTGGDVTPELFIRLDDLVTLSATDFVLQSEAGSFA